MKLVCSTDGASEARTVGSVLPGDPAQAQAHKSGQTSLQALSVPFTFTLQANFHLSSMGRFSNLNLMLK